MAKKNVQFPKVIYAILESDGFMIASKALATLVKGLPRGNDGEVVGVYELKEVKKLRLRDPELE